MNRTEWLDEAEKAWDLRVVHIHVTFNQIPAVYLEWGDKNLTIMEGYEGYVRAVAMTRNNGDM